MEIPLVFPSLEASPRRFIVNDTAGSIHEYRGTMASSPAAEPQRDTSQYFAEEQRRWRAAASVSTLREGIGCAEAVLTTSLLPEEPGVLCVSLLPSIANSSPILLQLDLGQTSKFAAIVKAQGFYWNRPGHPTTIALLLVDANAVVMRIALDSTTLWPSALDLWDVPEMVAARVASEYPSSANLCPSMVVPLSATALLMAPNPFLLAVDLSREQVYPWSKSKVLEEMKTRASKFGTLLKHGVDLVLGKVDHDQLVDMHPVSALCVADNDPRQILSLHSDGVVRHWKLEQQQPFEPWSVHEPHVQHIPSPDYWKGSDPFCLAMTARVYDQTLALAIHIHTHGTLSRGEDDDDEFQQTGHSLLVYGGPVEGDHVGNSHSIRLKVPPLALSLTGLSFDVHNSRCSLLALFSTDQIASTQYITYPPSNLSIVSQDPKVSCCDWLLDGLAQQERDRLRRLSFFKQLPMDGDLDAKLTQLDTYFLQYLFRPNFCRGTGLALPPREFIVRRALKQVIGITSVSAKSYSTERDLPVQVLQSLHAWGRQQGHRGRLALADGQQAAPMEVDGTMDSESVRKALKTHEQCWKKLLLAIWEHEQILRSQLCTAPTVSMLGKRGMVVMRLGSVSVWQRDVVNTGTIRSRLSSLDKVAAEVIQALAQEKFSTREMHGDQECLLGHFEWLVWSAVFQGGFGVDPDVLEGIRAALAALTAEPKVLCCLRNAGRQDKMSNVSEDELVEIIQNESFHNILLGVTPLNSAGGRSLAADRGYLFSTQQRATVSSLVLRTVDDIRKTLLGRLIVLATSRGAGRSIEMVLRMYIHSVTALWTCAQLVDMRFVPGGTKALKKVRLQAAHSGDDSPVPPRKRQHIAVDGPNMSSMLAVFGSRDKTTSLDSLLINASIVLSRLPESSSLSVSTLGLANSAVVSLLPFVRTSQPSLFSVQLPELAAIPPSSGAVTDEPKLAVRLLGLHTSIVDESDDSDLAPVRDALFAKCLLVASSSEKHEKGDAMVAQALHKFPFDPEDIVTSLKHVRTVFNHLSGKVKYELKLTKYLKDAIDNTPSENVDDLSKLWSYVFVTATALCKWDTAYKASIETPGEEKRNECLKRLVRTMVDSGGLADLLKMCVSLKSDEYSQMESLVQRTDLYSLAAETLAENSGNDFYSYLAVDPEPLSDYSGALYALHVSQEQWKAAAVTMEERYDNARKALADGPSTELGIEALGRREALIIDDIILASLGCVLAMKQVTEESSEVLYTTPASFLSTSFYSKDELWSRSVLCVSLKKLYCDKLEDSKAFARSILEQRLIAKQNPTIKIVEQLFRQGYYREGLLVAQVQNKLLPGGHLGQNLFANALVELLCSFLVPLTTGGVAATMRPTLSQCRSSFETIPLVPILHTMLDLRSPGMKLSCLQNAAVRKGASALLHRLTVDYSTAASPLAVEVAAAMLQYGPLPCWLETLLIYGHGENEGRSLFASRQTKQSTEYRGNPSSLLSLYTQNGMYTDACRLVTLVLRGRGDEAPDKKATMRLPEKGDIHHVPYGKIDLLWNLSQTFLDDGVGTDQEADDLLAARQQMEDLLKKHFELLRIGEMGLRSARVLVGE